MNEKIFETETEIRRCGLNFIEFKKDFSKLNTVRRLFLLYMPEGSLKLSKEAIAKLKHYDKVKITVEKVG